MAFWGVRFLLRINLVTGCSLPARRRRELRARGRADTFVDGGKHPIKNSVKFSLGSGWGGLRIDPRPPHKYDGETALRALSERSPLPRLRRGRTGARRQR